MKAIAIETSGRLGSVALLDDGAVISQEQFEHGLQYAAALIPLIERLCKGQGWTVRDVQQLYVSAGPGSFTGLRIGITLAKTLAFALPIKVVAVPTLRVLACNAPAEAKHVIVVLDAKREQIFTARFERVAGQLEERETAHLDSLSEMLNRSPKPVLLLGEGMKFHAKYVAGQSGIEVAAEEFWPARAAAVGELGTEMAARGQFADPLTLTPVYIRVPEAEEKWGKRDDKVTG